MLAVVDHTTIQPTQTARRMRLYRLWGASIVLVLGLIVTVNQAINGTGRLHTFFKPVLSLIKGRIKGWNAASSIAYLESLDPPTRATTLLMIYQNGLKGAWKDQPAKSHVTNAKVPGENGIAIRFQPQNQSRLVLYSDATPTIGYGELEIEARTVESTVDLLSIPLNLGLVGMDGSESTTIELNRFAGTEINHSHWRVFRIPLSMLGIPKRRSGQDTHFTGIVLSTNSTSEFPDVLIRRIALTPDKALPLPPKNVTIPVTVDIGADRHPISPYIYGIAVAPAETLKDLRPALHRWGGNPNTRYNWLTNAWNSARDWQFRNHGDDPRRPVHPGHDAVGFIESSRQANAEVLFTIPTIGWVAKNGDKSLASVQVPTQGGPPLDDSDGPIAGYDPAENRQATSVRSIARKGKPFKYPPDLQPDVPDDDFAVAQDEFVYFLVRHFGIATRGGVRFYAMDNEPDLWSATHTDVKPVRQGYDDILYQFTTYAAAVKDVDPAAQITGPVSWGWTGYLYSALDQGNDNYHTHADRKNHDDLPFLLWFLKQAKNYQDETGQRLLDVLDVHYYPQSDVYNDKIDPETAARRIRSVRSLYDPKYVDESWIGEPIRLIPRLKDWIQQGYPDTKLGITEWNFGGEKHISGALTIAETLGLFGREGVYLASYWTAPPKDSPAYRGFKMMLNPASDGHRGMEEISCRALSNNDARLASFAATDRKGSTLSLLLINKMPHTAITVPIDTTSSVIPAGTRATVFQLKADNSGQKAEMYRTGMTIASNKPLQMTLPPYSIILLRTPIHPIVKAGTH